MFTQRMQALYDRLDIDFIMPPDLALMFFEEQDKYVDIFKKIYAELQETHANTLEPA